MGKRMNYPKCFRSAFTCFCMNERSLECFSSRCAHLVDGEEDEAVPLHKPARQLRAHLHARALQRQAPDLRAGGRGSAGRGGAGRGGLVRLETDGWSR